MSEHIDKNKGFLKDKLGGYQADPPPEVWDSISAQIGGRSRRGKTIILLSAAASIALAVTLGITYFGREIPQDLELASQGISGQELIEQELSGQEETHPQVEGLEKMVLQTMAEVSATGTEEEFPFDISTASISEVMKTGQENSGQGSTGGTGQEASTIEASLVMEYGEAMVVVEAEEVEEALEAGENEKPEQLILDAGEVGDVEMMPDIAEKQERDPRWMLGAMLSPLYSFRDAEPDALAGTAGQESGMISYATGIQVGYRATRRLALESGIIYNKMGLTIGAPGIQVFSGKMDMIAAPMGPDSWVENVTAVTNTIGNIVSHSGEIYVNNYKLNARAEYNNVDEVFAKSAVADQGIQQHLDYLELPMNLRYTLLDKNFKIQLIGGMSTNFLVDNYVTMETPDGPTEIGYLTNVRNVNYSGNAGLGFVYHFLDQLSLSLEPRFRYYLNSVNDATLPSTRPYTFGIYTGLNYFF
jgi:hypothetical protein